VREIRTAWSSMWGWPEIDNLVAVTCPALAPTSCPSHLRRWPHRHDRRTFPIYNAKWSKVTGGIWRPYGPKLRSTFRSIAYRRRFRSNPRPVAKAGSALAPAYLRVRGTWENATWCAVTDVADIRAAGRIQRSSDPPALARRKSISRAVGTRM